MWQSFHTLCKCHFIKLCGFTEFGASLNISTTEHFLLRKHGQKLKIIWVFFLSSTAVILKACMKVWKRGKTGYPYVVIRAYGLLADREPSGLMKYRSGLEKFKQLWHKFMSFHSSWSVNMGDREQSFVVIHRKWQGC